MRPPRQLPRYRRDLPYGWVLGHFPVVELLRHAPRRALEVRVHPALEPARHEVLRSACARAGVPIVEDEAAVTAKRSKGTARVLALFRKAHEPLRGRAHHLLLAGTNEPGNAGTMLRTALAFGVEDVAVVGPDPFSPHVVRASLGAAFAVRIQSYGDLAAYRRSFPEREVWLLDGRAGMELGDVPPATEGRTVAVGPEWPGFRPEELRHGSPVRIAIDPRVESLNVAVAAGLALRALLPRPDAGAGRTRRD